MNIVWRKEDGARLGQPGFTGAQESQWMAFRRLHAMFTHQAKEESERPMPETAELRRFRRKPASHETVTKSQECCLLFPLFEDPLDSLMRRMA